MTTRRVAMGACLIWYLMVPPYRFDGEVWVVSQNLPVSQWTLAGRFDSFENCHQSWVAESVKRLQTSQQVPRSEWSRQQYGEYVALRAFLDGLLRSIRFG